MAEVTIYHNPRCSTSRRALQLIDELGVDADVVRYLDEPPDAATLHAIIDRLEDDPRDLVRNERWAELGVSEDDVATPDGVVEVLLRHPQLMQRPVIATADRTIIGRPTERVRQLLE